MNEDSAPKQRKSLFVRPSLGGLLGGGMHLRSRRNSAGDMTPGTGTPISEFGSSGFMIPSTRSDDGGEEKDSKEAASTSPKQSSHSRRQGSHIFRRISSLGSNTTKTLWKNFSGGLNSVSDRDGSPKIKGRASRAEAGEDWKHQTVKIRPKLFVMENQGKFEDDYQVGKLLGQGGFGQVYDCVHKSSGAERAVKILKKSTKPEQNDEIMMEFAVLRDMEHPNILKNYALYQDDDHFSVVTDLYKGGDLLDLLTERNLSESETAILIKHVLSCINYCHQNNIVHRDLKPDNILLEETRDYRDIKIIDFGLAARIEYDATNTVHTKLTGVGGSSYYMSPQVLEGSYTEACDIWAIGIICYMLLSGYAPFDGDDDAEIAEQIMEGTVYFDDPIWEEISDDALEFIDYLLIVEEDVRPTAEQALKHKWLQQQDHWEDGNEDSIQQSASASLTGLKRFTADSKLKQVAYSLIASQLLSKKDKESIDHDFRKLDLDCDGKLSPEDIQASHKVFFGGDEIEKEELDRIIAAVNYSGTGTIEYSEFVASTMMVKKLVTKENLTSVFHIIDSENTGYLTIDNIGHALGLEKGTMDNYILNKIIRPVDSTGNDTISLDDFISMMLSLRPSPNKLVTNNSDRRLLKRPDSMTRSFIRDTLKMKKNFSAVSNHFVSGISAGTHSIVSGTGRLGVDVMVGTGKMVNGVAVGTGKVGMDIVSGTGKLGVDVMVGTGKMVNDVAVGTGKFASDMVVGTGHMLKKGTETMVMGTSNAFMGTTAHGRKSTVGPKSAAF